MNLQPIYPPLRDGQVVQCALCLYMQSGALADLDASPGTFVCTHCTLAYVERNKWEVQS
jgi:hypothetical protein